MRYLHSYLNFCSLSFVIGFFVAFSPIMGFATHNLAGQITYIKTGPNSYEITLTTYTDPSQHVDRCYVNLEIYSVGGSQTTPLDVIQDVPRQNGPVSPDPQITSLVCSGTAKMGIYVFANPLAQRVKENIYKANYTFSGPGNFLIAYTDPARITNVVNMANSGNMAFHINTLIRNTPSLGHNNSPFFLNRPVDFACTNKIYTHNPGGTDFEGDSLHYQLINCFQGLGTPVTQFLMPSAFGGTFTQDPLTGLITWDSPQQVGIYNIAFIIEEFRNGIKIGEAIRDMAIIVSPCQNDPPIIEAITDTCVKAGENLVINIKSWDPNFLPTGDSLYFQLNNGEVGLNGPFASNVIPPATLAFNPPATLPVGTTDTVRATLNWATNCSHIRENFYQVDLYAHDNFSYYGSSSSQMLSTHHVIKIYVTPPAVTGLTLTTGPRQVSLNWDLFSCPNALGYKVYRNLSGSSGGLDSICCKESPEQAGFELIYANTDLNLRNYTDDLSGFPNLEGSICYTVVAYFTGNQLSCPSNVECVELANESFVLTHASIVQTDATIGEVFVSWSTPDTSKINKQFYPEPFTYQLHRADEVTGGGNFVQIGGVFNFNDTTYTDIGKNTVDKGYRYKTMLIDAIGKIAEADEASTIFLELLPLDQSMRLEWNDNTPWVNDSFQVFRSANFGGPFAQIAVVPATGSSQYSYLDLGLINYQDYCYFIRSFGNHPNLTDVEDSLINDSQKKCDQPRDLTPPCIDSIAFDTTADCATLRGTINWYDVDTTCAGDIEFFTVYKADKPGDPWVQVTTINVSQNSYNFSDPLSIADCYGISATDSAGNESEKRIFCFENCPDLSPSDIFSPNGDGFNDYFNPLKSRSAEIKSIRILDRWGAMVYAVENSYIDPKMMWNGNTIKGNEAPEGVYYYILDYALITLGGNIPMPKLAGFVVLIR